MQSLSDEDGRNKGSAIRPIIQFPATQTVKSQKYSVKYKIEIY